MESEFVYHNAVKRGERRSDQNGLHGFLPVAIASIRSGAGYLLPPANRLRNRHDVSISDLNLGARLRQERASKWFSRSIGRWNNGKKQWLIGGVPLL